MRSRLAGRHPLTVGAAILLGLSLYEFWVRLEDFLAWTAGIRHLSSVRGTSFLEDMKIIFEAPEMQQLGFKMLYLAAVIIFAVICLICRNRGRGMWVLFILALAAAVGGILLEIYALSSWLQVIKLIPLGLIAAGCITNIANHRKIRRERLRQYYTQQGYLPGGTSQGYAQPGRIPQGYVQPGRIPQGYAQPGQRPQGYAQPGRVPSDYAQPGRGPQGQGYAQPERRPDPYAKRPGNR